MCDNCHLLCSPWSEDRSTRAFNYTTVFPSDVTELTSVAQCGIYQRTFREMKFEVTPFQPDVVPPAECAKRPPKLKTYHGLVGSSTLKLERTNRYLGAIDSYKTY